MARAILYALPLVTVLFLSFAVFVVGAPQAYLAVRIWGGPTHDSRTLRLRVETLVRFDSLERPAPKTDLEIAVHENGRQVARWQGSVEGGRREVNVVLPKAPTGRLELSVIDTAKQELVAEGELRLSSASWRAGVRRRGGWIASTRPATLQVRAAVERGALAVPFPATLVFEVRDSSGPVAGAQLSFEPSGMELRSEEGKLSTNSRGRTRATLVPLEHNVGFSVQARTKDGRHASLRAALPVVPGALHAVLHGQELRITSPVPRKEAFYSVTTDSTRIAGGRLLLQPAPNGLAEGTVQLREVPAGPLFGVVGSEPELNGSSVVGWPLKATNDPQTTFDVPDRLLLDGLSLGYERNQRRMRLARWLAGLFTLLSLGLASLLVIGSVRRTDQEIARQLANFSESANTPTLSAGPRWLSLGIAVLCLMMGFGLVALWAIYRLG